MEWIKTTDLPHKYIAGCAQRFCSSGAEGDPHNPGDGTDDLLHDTEMIEHRDGAAEEDDHRQHLVTWAKIKKIVIESISKKDSSLIL